MNDGHTTKPPSPSNKDGKTRVKEAWVNHAEEYYQTLKTIVEFTPAEGEKIELLLTNLKSDRTLETANELCKTISDAWVQKGNVLNAEEQQQFVDRIAEIKTGQSYTIESAQDMNKISRELLVKYLDTYHENIDAQITITFNSLDDSGKADDLLKKGELYEADLTVLHKRRNDNDTTWVLNIDDNQRWQSIYGFTYAVFAGKEVEYKYVTSPPPTWTEPVRAAPEKPAAQEPAVELRRPPEQTPAPARAEDLWPKILPEPIPEPLKEPEVVATAPAEPKEEVKPVEVKPPEVELPDMPPPITAPITKIWTMGIMPPPLMAPIIDIDEESEVNGGGRGPGLNLAGATKATAEVRQGGVQATPVQTTAPISATKPNGGSNGTGPNGGANGHVLRKQTDIETELNLIRDAMSIEDHDTALREAKKVRRDIRITQKYGQQNLDEAMRTLTLTKIKSLLDQHLLAEIKYYIDPAFGIRWRDANSLIGHIDREASLVAGGNRDMYANLKAPITRAIAALPQMPQ